ncbi:MAG: restriction endonuclease subunit S [Flavobacteriales bacterium]|nr:restriction endonuclease subunit S [Flavobacteriales bacterium]
MREDWAECSINEVSDRIHYGYTASAKDPDANGAKYLRITDIQDGAVDWSTVPVCDIDDSQLDKFQLSPNDLVFARTGGTVGKSFLLSSNVPPKAVFASYLIRIILNEAVLPKYIYLFFQSLHYWSQIELGKTGLKTNVNAQILSKLRFNLAPSQSSAPLYPR